uniref:Uncharacterized protein n=1 Tax=Gorilla gorilla gorilla TaxID=9595 RepID=A0A2I2Y920_GORGO
FTAPGILYILWEMPLFKEAGVRPAIVLLHLTAKILLSFSPIILSHNSQIKELLDNSDSGPFLSELLKLGTVYFSGLYCTLILLIILKRKFQVVKH